MNRKGIGGVILLAMCGLCFVWAGWADAPAAALKVAVVTGGHAFDENAFLDLFKGHPDLVRTHIALQDDSEVFEDIGQWPYDVLVLFNMTQKISEQRRANFLKLLDQGVGVVALHHCMGAFLAWPEFRHIIGAKYYRTKGEDDGVAHEALTYQHGVDFTIHIADEDHPVTRGLSDFEVHDETYKNCWFAQDNHVLLTTDHASSDKTVAWTRTYRNARVVYMEMGHGPSIYANENYRRLVAQSIRWVAGDESDQ